MTDPIPFQRDQSQADRALLGIRDMVLRGEFKTGERLPELVLVDLLGVSRTPIRAALQKLAEEGILEAAQPAGYVVRGFSEAEIADAIEVRGTLEALAARMAAERGLRRPQLEAMADCLDQLDELLAEAVPGSDYLSQYSQLNGRFHQLMVESSGSEIVVRALARAAALPFAGHNAFVSIQGRIPGSLEILKAAQRQHREILEAIEARSSARVEPLVKEHARIAHKNLQLVLKNAEAMKNLPGSLLIRRRP
ncbi:MAG: GntR family transcriptional regulator [Rhodocyclales bacterium]|nr:GntR family transcriptional regulator [Rhodocyclales bacterium]